MEIIKQAVKDGVIKEKNAIAVQPRTVCNAATGKVLSLAEVKSKNGLFVYGSAYTSKATKDVAVNNRSLIVQLKSKKLNALLMGDIYYAGIRKVNKYYGDAIYGPKYDVCKIGHHGLRNYQSSVTGRMNIELIKIKCNQLCVYHERYCS